MITILESEIAGFGVSGRDGGALGYCFPVGLLVMLFGRHAAIALQTALNTVVDEVANAVEAEAIV